ncbi:hypothetical protein Rhe02_37570 [Rhizocola hellebori]|uniref:Uncharacterized protein n=1 Tax=Rhizocola hellebori TaxID=1392758 RepID=A0A8J3Q9T7_9ACTN|nr:hypothetical protein [Rhizocola hellebori]GIH05690.1 hypothetical protein Rhe02_37570 [Rhizocola hellebori]
MTSTLAPHQLLRIGQPVHVNHRASWLAATVTCLTPRQIGVAYQTSSPAPLGDTVLPWAVRPADGALLRAARRVAAGDEVIFGSTTRTVAAAWKGRDGWLVVHFTDGGQPALVLPGAVLRLVDRTPAVTVNGLPITG